MVVNFLKKQALCSADPSRRVGTKECIGATNEQLEQIRAQGAALRLLLHDVLVPDWLLAKCSGEDLSTGDHPSDHDESLYSLARFGRNISSHALRCGSLLVLDCLLVFCMGNREAHRNGWGGTAGRCGIERSTTPCKGIGRRERARRMTSDSLTMCAKWRR